MGSWQAAANARPNSVVEGVEARDAAGFQFLGALRVEGGLFVEKGVREAVLGQAVLQTLLLRLAEGR